MPFQPVDSRRLYEQVADQIGALIRAGEFAPGQRLPAERDLAKSLRVSRPVVREAMIALEIGGLIEVRVGAGAFVRDQPLAPAAPINTGHSPSDILSARMLIEGETAALAAARATPLDLAAIAAQQDEMIAEHAAGREWRARRSRLPRGDRPRQRQRGADGGGRAPVAGAARAGVLAAVGARAARRQLDGDGARPRRDPRRDPRRQAQGRRATRCARI